MLSFTISYSLVYSTTTEDYEMFQKYHSTFTYKIKNNKT